MASEAFDHNPTFDYNPVTGEYLLEAMSKATGLPAYLSITASDVGPGRLVCELNVTEELLNPFGAAHGGVLAALVDHVLGAVCLPVIPQGSWPATTGLTLHLLAPVRTGTLTAQATIISLKSSAAIVRVDATNAGRAVGAAQGSVSIMAPRTGT